MTTPDLSKAESVIEHLLGLRYFDAEEEGGAAIPAFYRPGSGPLVVIVGDNSSGKSFFRRLIRAVYSIQKIECIAISMQGRQQDYGGMKSFIYGCEDYESTGVNSSRTVTVGVRTLASRTSPHAIVWDEPDLGLSESSAAGMGIEIREYAEKPNPLTGVMAVITHSKPLVKQLVGLDPHYIHLGSTDPPKTLKAWLRKRTPPRRLADIQAEGRDRFHRIQAILNEKKE